MTDTAPIALDEPTFTVNEFATAVGVKPITVRRWMDRGLVTYVTTPTGRKRLPKSEAAKCMTVHNRVTADLESESATPVPAAA